MNSRADLPLSLRDYYATARGLSTAVAAVALPLFSKVVGSESAAYVFPPLGDVEGVARVGFVALCLAVSLGVYLLVSARSSLSPARVIWCALLVGIVGLASYLAAYAGFVRRVDIPTLGKSVFVSVGYQRTPFANQVFGSASDSEMLKKRGTSDEEIERLWTLKSVIVARLVLYFSCVLTSLALLFLFSFAVAHDMPLSGPAVDGSGPAPNE
jgi:hypothetical protein